MNNKNNFFQIFSLVVIGGILTGILIISIRIIVKVIFNINQ